MKPTPRFSPVFVRNIPDLIEDGVLYVSIEYGTALHRCACGCGFEVVTPFSPSDWELSFDGCSVSLNPSIGNWSFPCRSHYWIARNEVLWSHQLSERDIYHARRIDRARRVRLPEPVVPGPTRNQRDRDGCLMRVLAWLRRVGSNPPKR